MAGRMGNKFVALCSVAVGAVYVTGYVLTDSSHTALASTSSMPPSGQTQTKASGSTSTKSTGGSSATPTSQPTSGSKAKAASGSSPTGSSKAPGKSASTSSQQKYLDGTYHGTGTNQIGAVSVALTIKSGKITNVQITQCETHYPESFINPVLPQEVVQRQSYQVTIVSGATLSTYDFAYAVYQALGQAKNPNYK